VENEGRDADIISCQCEMRVANWLLYSHPEIINPAQKLAINQSILAIDFIYVKKENVREMPIV
jgi:hypothetical protein